MGIVNTCDKGVREVMSYGGVIVMGVPVSYVLLYIQGSRSYRYGSYHRSSTFILAVAHTPVPGLDYYFGLLYTFHAAELLLFRFGPSTLLLCFTRCQRCAQMPMLISTHLLPFFIFRYLRSSGWRTMFSKYRMAISGSSILKKQRPERKRGREKERSESSAEHLSIACASLKTNCQRA